MISIKKPNTDTIGAIASTICMIHCLLTPVLFITKSCASTHCCAADTPIWWSVVDFVFAAIAFFAIWESTQFSTKKWVKYGLWFSWLSLSFIIVNEKVSLISLFDYAIYIPAISLVLFHIYNQRYGCNKDCCVEN